LSAIPVPQIPVEYAAYPSPTDDGGNTAAGVVTHARIAVGENVVHFYVVEIVTKVFSRGGWKSGGVVRYPLIYHAKRFQKRFQRPRFDPVN